MLVRLLGRRWNGPRHTLEPARPFLLARSRSYLLRLLGDRGLALAAAVSFAAAPFEREGIRETGADEMPLLWYTNVVGEIRQHNVNAFLVRDGLWIDVHLSSVLSIGESKRLFGQFLGALRFAENQVAQP